MASDDELKDEELVDFEGSDYELDSDCEDLEDIEEDEEEEQQQPSDLLQTELHGRSDAEALQEGSNEASETFRSSAVVGSHNLENTGGSKSSFTCEASETLREAGKEVSACVEASETLRDAGKEALVCAEASEAPERGSNGASGTPEFHDTFVSTTANSINIVTSLPKALETSCRASSREAVKSQSASNESSRTQQLRSKKEGMESGEIEEARDEKDKKAILGPAPSSVLDGSDAHCTLESADNRLVKLSKPDLEDGELDESALLQNYGFEEEAKDETAEREKKRRKEDSVMERQVDGTESNEAKQLEETGDSAAKQHSSGSDKAMEQFAGFSSAGARGVGLRMIGLGQGSLAPGIMGPGRPLMPLGIGSLAQGFGPFGAIAPHGRPQVHLQEVLAQEHLFRAHALQLAQETLVNAIRSPLARPLGAGAFQPFLGFDVLGPRSHAPKHFPRPPPDLMLGPMGNFARGQRPTLAAVRAGVAGKVGGQAEPTLNKGIGRQFGWSAASGPNDMQPLKRGRGRGRGLRTGSWGDAEPFGPVPGSLGSAGNPRAMMNVAATSNMRHMNPDEAIFYQTTLAAPQDLAHNGFDARWKIEKERMLRNGLPHFRMPENAMIGGNFSDASMEFGKDPGKFSEGKSLRSQESSRSGSLAARLGPPAQAKAATLMTTDSGDLAPGSNVIKLLQPVRKSRILTVSGLPEDTPMSTVAEVFEKLGKITDFKKSSKGDTFTISYSNETEAVTAKRNLHRSCLAGKQITVDYAHQ